jgi:hypothetical protein
MITSSAALLILYLTGSTSAWSAFHVLWVSNAAIFLFTTGFALLMDPQTGRHAWREAVLFPGVVNLAIIVGSCAPRLAHDIGNWLGVPRSMAGPLTISAYLWLTVSLVLGYLVKVVERHRGGRLASMLLLYVAGYGSLLCACTFASYVKEALRSDMSWDKTEKTGKVTIPT